jgi:hypothetical protein
MEDSLGVVDLIPLLTVTRKATAFRQLVPVGCLFAKGKTGSVPRWKLLCKKPLVDFAEKVEAGGARILASKTFLKAPLRFLLGRTVVLLRGTILLLGLLVDPGVSEIDDLPQQEKIVPSEARGILPVFPFRLIQPGQGDVVPDCAALRLVLPDGCHNSA